MPCSNSLECTCWELSDEYPCARFSVIFHLFCIVLNWPKLATTGICMERHMTKNSTCEKTMQPDWKRFNLHAKRTPLDFKTTQHGENAPTCILLYLAKWYRRMQVGAYSPCWVICACCIVLAVHQYRTWRREPMVKGNVRPYCHMEFLNARPNSYSIFRCRMILRFRSQSSFRISSFFS